MASFLGSKFDRIKDKGEREDKYAYKFHEAINFSEINGRI